MTVSLTAAAVSTAGLGIRAANTLGALFLLTDDIKGGKSGNQQNHADNNVVNHRQLLFGQGVFFFQVLVGAVNQKSNGVMSIDQ